VRAGFLLRVAVASAASGAALLLPIGDIPAAIVAAVVFLGVGFAVGMVPKELRDVLGPDGPMRRGPRPAAGRSE
jgi:hypothetical protein